MVLAGSNVGLTAGPLAVQARFFPEQSRRCRELCEPLCELCSFTESEHIDRPIRISILTIPIA